MFSTCFNLLNCRGLKHLKNKSKYKGKKGANKLSDNEKGENRRGENWQLGTNRDRYISSSENEDSEAGDFQLLANAPISVGGHFQFKSSVQELSNLTDTFLNLDTNLLNYSIGTIPFNVRCEINQEYLQVHTVTHFSHKIFRMMIKAWRIPGHLIILLMILGQTCRGNKQKD